MEEDDARILVKVVIFQGHHGEGVRITFAGDRAFSNDYAAAHVIKRTNKYSVANCMLYASAGNARCRDAPDTLGRTWST